MSSSFMLKSVFAWSQTALMSSKSNMFKEGIWKEEISEYDALITRSRIHCGVCHVEKQEIPSTSKSRKSHRRKLPYIICNMTNKQNYTQIVMIMLLFPKGLSLPNCRLPMNGQVLTYSFKINQKHPGVNNFENMCLDVLLHWISCNVEAQKLEDPEFLKSKNNHGHSQRLMMSIHLSILNLSQSRRMIGCIERYVPEKQLNCNKE